MGEPGDSRATKRRRVATPPPTSDTPSTPTNPPTKSSPCPIHTPTPPTTTNTQNNPLQQPRKTWFRRPSIVWYRGHDLRVEDHPALLAAAQRGGPVVPLFICEDTVIEKGEVKRWWLRESLRSLRQNLRNLGVDLTLRCGKPRDELLRFIADTGADAVFWNRAYEPALLSRDELLREELVGMGMTAESFKAELLIEPWELEDGKGRKEEKSDMEEVEGVCGGNEMRRPFNVFHSYMHAWMALPPPPQPFPSPSSLQPVEKEVKSERLSSLRLEVDKETAERLAKLWTPGVVHANRLLEKFLHEIFPAFGEEKCRKDFNGTSRLSPHLSFGELSPRRLYHAARVKVSSWERHHHNHVHKRAYGSIDVKMGEEIEPKLGEEGRDAIKGGNRDQNCGSSDLDDFKRLAPPRMKMSDVGEVGQQPQGFKTRATSPVSNEGSNSTGTLKKKGPSTNNYLERGKKCASVDKPLIFQSAKAFLKNLCLRDFAYHVSYHFPDFYAKPLVKEFAMFPWAPDDGGLEKWKSGLTGYPLVDAAMRQLRATGWIHNMMRFLLASFLTKYLLLPWQHGLLEFYSLLIDGDHSANALGWQWTSGCNSDSFPFNTLVNPAKLGRRLDSSGAYIRRWLPELAKLPVEVIHQPWRASPDVLEKAGITLGKEYPNRVVDGAFARNRARDAMQVMRRIFLAAKPARHVKEMLTVEDVFRDWPEDEDEMTTENLILGEDKMALLPSLWSLSQYDVPPPNFTHAASSIEDIERDMGLGNDSLEPNNSVPTLVTSLEMPLGAPVLPTSNSGTYPSYPPYFQQQIVVNQQVSGAQPVSNPLLQSMYNPGMFFPGLQMNNIPLPNMQMPGTQIPGFPVPGMQIPGMQIPGMQVPGMQVPGMQAPGMQMAGNVPMANMQVPGTPWTNFPGTNMQMPNMQLVMTPAQQKEQHYRQTSEPTEATSMFGSGVKLTQNYGTDGLPVQNSLQDPDQGSALPIPASSSSGYIVDPNTRGPGQNQAQSRTGTRSVPKNRTLNEPEKISLQSPDIALGQFTTLTASAQTLAEPVGSRSVNSSVFGPTDVEAASVVGTGTDAANQPQSRGPKKDSKRPKTAPTRRNSGSARTKKVKESGKSQRISKPRSGEVPPSSGEPTTVEGRRKILEDMINEEGNVYHNLAKYLASTYDFTPNTNRETSKDYVRLCNLKDEYHRRCIDVKDKLKIYKIKSFFSDILKLQVTGEWDRHNHGGVRGPYVYGIRATAGTTPHARRDSGKSQGLRENQSRSSGKGQRRRKASTNTAN